MIKEIWKDIPGYEGIYQVSNIGNVKSLKFGKEKILKLGMDGKSPRQYYKVILMKDKKKESVKIHKLMAMAFLNHIPCGYKIVVDHINNDRLDNRIENLQLISSRENSSKDKKLGSSKHTGVHFHKNKNKFNANIRINGKKIYLGSFDCEIEASEAYQNALKMYNNNDLSFMESKRKRNNCKK
jgi:hypothetical protein